ncbi:MAG: DoxX-like family protein [Bacteroidetes bacterium]|nr:DoxX-like family protein [Bacteroidota bacterium]
MRKQTVHNIITWLIAAVWLANGLLCKVLGIVPRHEQIVARILGAEYAHPLTVLIGISEIGMAVWVVSRLFIRLNATLQIAIVLTMNVIEFSLAPDLLLWGRLNIVFAILFSALVYYNDFVLAPSKPKHA